MNKRPLLKGSVNEKLDQIDRLIRHLKVRSRNYVIGVTPPIPVFDYIDKPDNDGVVFRKIMPANGIITVGCMWIEEFSRKLELVATLTTEDADGNSSVNIPVTRQAMGIKPNLPVNFGQRITLSINPAEKCRGVWTAFLFEIDSSEINQQKQLMSGFLELADMAVEELDYA